MSEENSDFYSSNLGKWAIFELWEFASLERDHLRIAKELKAVFLTEEIFIPIKINKIASKEIFVKLEAIDCYAFVKHTGSADFEHKVQRYRGSLVSKALRTNAYPAYYPNRLIEEYIVKLKTTTFPYTPSVGDTVTGTHGAFNNMCGCVTRVDYLNNVADVLFKMRTRDVLAENMSFMIINPTES
jgi:transcription antitermination factor NusG